MCIAVGTALSRGGPRRQPLVLEAVHAYSRQQRRFPPELSEYVLDEQQWYPPVFPLALTACPWTLSERGSRLIPIAIDALRLILLLATVGWLTGLNRVAIIEAGVVYATTPILTSYNVQLNPRGLGALLLDGLIIFGLWHHLYDGGELWPLVIISLLASVILLTHKMTTQLLWFLGLAAGLFLKSWIILAVIPVSLIGAFAISGGFYWRVWVAHVDIVSFWHRNWRWLQGDPVRESPVYGSASLRSPTRFYQPGLAGALRHSRYMFGFNPWAWFLPFALLLSKRPADLTGHFVALWCWLVIAFAVATLIVPSLRAIGSGYFYLYNAAFPVALAWGYWAPTTAAALAMFIIALTMSCASLSAFYFRLKRTRKDSTDEALVRVLDFLGRAPKGTVWCLPFQPSDLVAYHTGQRVLYGGHGYGFRRLEQVFPRLLESVTTVCRRYEVRYLLTTDKYLPATLISELTIRETAEFGPYRVLVLARSDADPTAARQPAARLFATP